MLTVECVTWGCTLLCMGAGSCALGEQAFAKKVRNIYSVRQVFVRSYSYGIFVLSKLTICKSARGVIQKPIRLAQSDEQNEFRRSVRRHLTYDLHDLI